MASDQRWRRLARRTGAIWLIVGLITSVALSFSSAQAASATPLAKAIKNNQVSVTAKANGNYSDISLSLTNKTGDHQRVDIVGTYFTPPDGRHSQRLGVAFVKDTPGNSEVDLDPHATKDVVAQAFCIDSGNGIPGSDEIFTFGGDTKDLTTRPDLKTLLIWYRAHPDASHNDLQSAIWSIETDTTGGRNHWTEGAGTVLKDATGYSQPGAQAAKVNAAKDEATTTATTAAGVALSSLFGASALLAFGDPDGSINPFGTLNDLLKIKDTGSDFFNKLLDIKTVNKPFEGVSMDPLTSTTIGLAEDNLQWSKDPANENPMLKGVFKQSMNILNIMNDANDLHEKSGYSDNLLQSVGLSSLMNIGSNAMMDGISELGWKSAGNMEAIANIILPESLQKYLPSNTFKQAFQSIGDVTRAVSQALGEGSLDPINNYAQSIKDGDSSPMLRGWADIGDTLGKTVASMEDVGVVKTMQDFYTDAKRIYDTGSWKDVAWDNVKALGEEAKAGKGVPRGYAELGEVTGDIVGDIEAKGLVQATKDKVGGVLKDTSRIITKFDRKDWQQLSENVGDDAEASLGNIGTGYKEGSQLAGSYYEENGGVIGGAVEFGADVGRVARYSWLGEKIASWF